MWNEIFSEEGSAYGLEANDFLIEAADKLPPGPVLCLAEGEGRNAVFLAQRGHQVTAVDSSEVAMKNAEEFAQSRGVSIETIVCDLADFEIKEGHYAGIVSIWAHMPPAIRKRLHAKCVAALRPGGAFILEAYTPEQVGRGTGGPPVPELTMTQSGLREELSGLDFIVAQELTREIHEGRLHNGVSSVVQVVARAPE